MGNKWGGRPSDSRAGKRRDKNTRIGILSDCDRYTRNGKKLF